MGFGGTAEDPIEGGPLPPADYDRLAEWADRRVADSWTIDIAEARVVTLPGSDQMSLAAWRLLETACVVAELGDGPAIGQKTAHGTLEDALASIASEVAVSGVNHILQAVPKTSFVSEQ